MPQYERISLMNNVKQTFTITIPSKTGYMNLTEDVMECVRRANIRNGIISISSMHTTASVFTATNDIEALNGYLKYYEKVSTLAEEPLRAAICHQLAGGSVVTAICDSEISLGLTQYIIYMDFDGEREKTVEINIIGE